MPTNAIRHVKDAVRTFNKHVLNPPAMMLLAGRRHWYASVIRHTGRRSGKTHATPPVVADRVAGGFVIPLPYGTGVDWLRNSLASSSATLTVGGQTFFEVVNPQILGGDGRCGATLATPATRLPALRHRPLRQVRRGQSIR